jgi:hypothetical protein
VTATRMWLSLPNGGGRGGGVLTLTDEEALRRLERGERLQPMKDRAALIAELVAAAQGPE